MRTLSIDIETYSSYDLKKFGVYKYVEASDFEILMLAYKYDDEPVGVIDLTKTGVPELLIPALCSPDVLKKAFNANFERTCIAKHFSIDCPPEQWECTMVRAAMLGLPMSLAQVASALKLDVQKDTAGTALINYFSKPCKPSKANNGRTRNLPEHATDKWQAFLNYCAVDVEVESAISKELSFFKISEFERKLWCLDQRINDKGVKLDLDLVAGALKIDAINKQELTEEAISLTGLDNPNSVSQLCTWLSEEMNVEITSLKKSDIPVLIENAKDEAVTRILEIRQELSKTSIKKYAAMEMMTCKDEASRGLLQYYGANRTGRWSGRKIQMQNLTKNDEKMFGKAMANISLARNLVKSKDSQALKLLFGKDENALSEILSQLIRTAFIAREGNRLLVSDFSAIEARVIAWLAKEKWRIDIFNGHGKIYEASAAQMFKVPIESITKGNPLRQRGKVAELACGYQGGVGALIAMGALKMGLTEEELPDIIQRWRKENPNIVKLWYDVEKAAIHAIEDGPVQLQYGLRFKYIKGCLVIVLPSGRPLWYQNARIGVNKFDKKAIKYRGMDQITKQWTWIDTYGGKLVENIVQAIARDCLAEVMIRVDEAGYPIIMCVHDEIIADVPKDFGSIEHMNEIMGQPLSWAPGLPLSADGYETNFYMKED